MKKVIIISQDKNQYFFPYISSKDIIMVNPKESKNLIYRIIRKLTVMLKLPFYKYILGEWVSMVPNFDKIIIMDSGYVLGMKKYLQKLNNKCDINLFLWNHVNKSREKFIEDFNDKNKTWTFVKEDSEKYNIRLNTTLYSKEVILKNKKIQYDILFVGREKGKAKEILSMVEKLSEKGLKAKIHLIRSQEYYPIEIDKYLTNEFIEYKDYLDLISESAILLDYAEPNNHGLSMRVLEAIYFKKKLITNNVAIKNEKFYNKNNIFVIEAVEKDQLEELYNFCKSPYQDIDDDQYLEYYSIEEWLKRFDIL